MLIDGTMIRQSLDMQSNILTMCVCMVDNPNCDIGIIQNFVETVRNYLSNYDMDCIDTSVCMMISYVYHYVIFDRLDFEQGHTIDAFITTASLKECEKIHKASEKSSKMGYKNESIWKILHHHLIPRYKTKSRDTVDSISKNKRNNMIKKF